jgi:lysophospholipase L1-like esterase/pimeloyl-ACP methyl ester carboxylesterase
MKYFSRTILALLALWCCGSLPAQYERKISIACIGASITQGATLENPLVQSFPAQLQALLGEGYQVNNYGVSGATLLKKGDLPYWQTPQYRQALASRPDMVVIDLGGNDSKLVNRVHLDEFEQDYHALIRSFAQLPSHPRIVLLLPVTSFVTDTTQIWNPVIVGKIIPHIQQVAYEERVELLNMYAFFSNRPELLPDNIHPNAVGAGVMAGRLREWVLQKRDTTFHLQQQLPVQGKSSSFYGYACTDFNWHHSACKIVTPRWAAPGHPWVWRARFWGHEPQTDIALLERGFHVVYCDVAELFGNSEAISRWNAFYALLHHAGLSAKAVMEGMSRGGVYIYNWAAANPGKVVCVYADNPVLDLKSWPGSAVRRHTPYLKEWETFKKDYGLASDEEALRFSGSPVDKVEQIVKGNFPMLHVCGDADEDVPMNENTLPFEQKVKALGGNITVIHKPGFKHHPHSLPDPTPIVSFILQAVETNGKEE